jgi:hypothetical protein
MPVELVIDKEELSDAEQWHSFHEGTPEAALNICKMAVSKYTELYGVDPGHLEWEDLDIIVKIEVPAGA